MVELADARDLKSLGRDTIPVRARSAAPPRRRKARFVTGQEVSCPVNFYACGSFSRKSLLRNLLREPLCFTQPTLYRQLANATRPFCVGAPPLPKKACCAIFFGSPMFYARQILQQGRNSPALLAFTPAAPFSAKACCAIFFGSPYFLQAGEIAVSFSHFVMWLNVK